MYTQVENQNKRKAVFSSIPQKRNILEKDVRLGIVGNNGRDNTVSQFAGANRLQAGDGAHWHVHFKSHVKYKNDDQINLDNKHTAQIIDKINKPN